MISSLQKIGLSEKEALVYIATLELGSGSILDISKKSNVKRSTVYDVIEELQKQGLISKIIKQKKIHFIAAAPDKIIELAEEIRSNTEKIIPELEAIHNLTKKKPTIQYFEGNKGLINVYNDILKGGGEISAFVSSKILDDEELSDYILNNFTPKRIKNKIPVKSIAPDTDWMVNEYKEKEDQFLRKIKLIDKDQYPFATEIIIYGKDKVGMISFENKIGVIIKSKDVQSTWKNIFDLTWNLIK